MNTPITKKIPSFIPLILSICLTACGYPLFLLMTDPPPQDVGIHPRSIDEAWRWTVGNIEYDRNVTDNTPETVYKTRRAHCVGFSVLLSYFGKELGQEILIIGIKKSNGKNHTICKIGDEYIEPQVYGKIYDKHDLDIIETFTYNEAYWILADKSISSERRIYRTRPTHTGR